MTSGLNLSRPAKGVLLAELARPEVLNALNGGLNAALAEAVAEAARDGETRVFVLAGAGDKAFSAGADLKEMRGLSGPALRRYIEATWVPIDALANSPIISIAVLHGYVLGGGAELALACDMRVAAKELAFGFPEISLGSLPGSGGMQRLPACLGRDRALEIMITGRRLDAQEAFEAGLVTRLAPAGDTARDTAITLAREIAERPAETLRYVKAAMALDACGVAARAFHGLASATFQMEPGYRRNTATFG